MKTSTRNVVIALGLFAAFTIYYHAYEPADRSVVPSHRARQTPAVYVPPGPKFDPEESRQRQEFQQRLADIYGRDLQEQLANRKGPLLLTPLPPGVRDYYYSPMPAAPAPPDPARPVKPLKTPKPAR